LKKNFLIALFALLWLTINAQEIIKPNDKGYFHIEIRDDVYVISNMAWGGLAEKGTATQNAQLIIGKKKALLIDTSLPKAGFADYARSLTSLPRFGKPFKTSCY
jgi:hypothetical protein